mgnify:CR=1 FL=1
MEDALVPVLGIITHIVIMSVLILVLMEDALVPNQISGKVLILES